MATRVSEIISLCDECTSLAKEIAVCLQQEKLFLLEFRTEDLLQNNTTKENLIQQLQSKKHLLRELISTDFGSRNALESLDGEEGHRWRRSWSDWLRSWEKLKGECESNQQFLDHSLRNLDLMTENLKRLFHHQSLYNAKGNRVDSQAQGRVVEVRL